MTAKILTGTRKRGIFNTLLDSAAVSIFVVILVELTNTETAVVSPHRALLNFQKATIQRGVLSEAFCEIALPYE